MTSGQAIFEELRFVWELMAAEYLFLLPFARRKKGWLPLAIGGLVLFSLLSQGYFFWLERVEQYGELGRQLVGQWYIVLALLTVAYSRLCFSITLCDALYIGISGYAAQHVVYVLVHEVLALAVFPAITRHLLLYAAVSVLACAGFYTFLYRMFARRLSLCGGQLNPDTPAAILYHVLLLAVLMFCTFGCQRLFHFDVSIRMLSAQIGVLVCLLILGLQFFSYRMIQAGRERAVIQQMLRDGERQYAHSKELIDMVNRSVHDPKHTLRALRTMQESDRMAFVEETERNLEQYQRLVHTDNELLNTILAEKSLYCESRGIRFTCTLGKAELDFVSVPDLYTLLGNAIDNAVESVIQLQEEEKRVVQLSIQTSGGCVCIQTNNYYAGRLQLENGLPRTTKADAAAHGYGLRSIRYLAKKYGGSMSVSCRDQVFVLQVILPIPRA